MTAMVKDVPPLPFEGNLLCPFQQHENDLPRIRMDISLGAPEFLQVMRIMYRWELDIAPFCVVVGGVVVPVTPLPSPANAEGLSNVPFLTSHHILQIWDSTDPTYNVDLLTCDDDIYFIAFRRWKNQVRGNWYRFSGTDCHPVPSFINAVDIHMNSSHGNGRVGGYDALRMILYQLGKFQDNLDPRRAEFKRACHSAMVTFFEPRRLRSSLLEVYGRIEDNLPLASIALPLWKKIGDWASLSRRVLGHCVAGDIKLDLALPNYYTHIHGPDFNDIGAVIGRPNTPGELLIIRICRNSLGLTQQLKEALLVRGLGVGVPDHQFDINAGLGEPPLIFRIAR